MVRRRIFDRGIAEPAAAIATADGPPRQFGDKSQNLFARVGVSFPQRALEPFPEIAIVIAQIGGGEFVLGGEAAIEARLGDASALDDLIHADGPNPLAIK